MQLNTNESLYVTDFGWFLTYGGDREAGPFDSKATALLAWAYYLKNAYWPF